LGLELGVSQWASIDIVVIARAIGKLINLQELYWSVTHLEIEDDSYEKIGQSFKSLKQLSKKKPGNNS